MAGPWEDYQPAAASAPWTEYAGVDTEPEASKPSGAQRLAALLTGMRDPIAGGAQMLTNALPSSVVEAGNAANNWLADKTGLVANLPAGGVDQFERQREAGYQASRGAEAGTFDGARLAGNILSPANLALAARAPAAATLAGRIASGAGVGAASAALNPVTTSDPSEYWSDKAAQVGTGAAFGGAMPVLTSAIGRVISPAASRNPDVALLRSEGVRPTIGQTLGGWANTVEEKAQSLPIVGDMITNARNNARQEFNRAAINRALAPIGNNIDEVGNAGVSQAQGLVGDAYDAARAQLGNFRLDKPAIGELRTIQQMVTQLPPQQQSTFNNVLKAVGTDVSPRGYVNAEGFGRITSKLGKDAASFKGSTDAYQQQLGDALGELNATLERSAMRANPKAAAAKQAADSAYANLVRIEGAAKGTADGVFTPGQLASAVRVADRSVRKRATAGGNALMQDLSSAGQSVLGNKVPNSGTADRLMLGGAGLGAYLVDPSIPAALIGGAALYTSPAQAAARVLAASRPQAAQAARDAVLKAAPSLIPAASQVGLGLLNYENP